MITKELLSQNYNSIRDNVNYLATRYNRNPSDIKILAVSKTQNHHTILKGIAAGIPIFAESFAQEFRDKYSELTNFTTNNIQCEFHFIGHLQSNKVKYVVPHTSTIHTIDSLSNAKEVSKQALKFNKTINILIQINTSAEPNKSGILPESARTLSKEILLLPNINLLGLMTIGTFSEDEIIIRKEFSMLRESLLDLNKALGINLSELSMGMSHDYDIAIQEQATMIRIGTAIFGERKRKEE